MSFSFVYGTGRGRFSGFAVYPGPRLPISQIIQISGKIWRIVRRFKALHLSSPTDTLAGIGLIQWQRPGVDNSQYLDAVPIGVFAAFELKIKQGKKSPSNSYWLPQSQFSPGRKSKSRPLSISLWLPPKRMQRPRGFRINLFYGGLIEKFRKEGKGRRVTDGPGSRHCCRQKPQG